MQFSYDWLKTWVSPELNADDLAHLLTMSGLEVEETELAAPAFTGVVIAEVKQVEKHPDADRLNITQVDAGTGELIQIVCGAPNVKVGIKIPCALPGAVLPGDFKIKPTKMRGQTSNGMLCSGKEIGVADDVDGLLILPEDAPIGMNIREYLGLDDALFTLKITPNRTDCLSIKGIAREVAALKNIPLTQVVTTPVVVNSQANQPVVIDAPEACGRFLTRVIEGVNAQAKTPAWMKTRLERSGIRSVSALVDIGNYVMLELGQPMHVFDANKLTGSLHVRFANDGEELACLNEKIVKLKSNTLVVADEAAALSMAGLMGGVPSSVTDTTNKIVLESAFFAPSVIKGQSRQYGFSSDSSFRFERGVDFLLQKDAIERATALVTEICGGQVGDVLEAVGVLPDSPQVEVRLARIAHILGVHIPSSVVQTILHDLGLNPVATEAGFVVTSPSYRFDIEIEVDLIEEIARVYGYDKIPDDKTSGLLRMLEKPETQKPRFGIYEQMARRGYQEVVSYAFVDEAWEQDFANNDKPIRLKNPLASHLNVMRSTLIGGLVQILGNNLNRKQNRVRLFEVARVFSTDENGAYIQTERLAGLAFGSAKPEQWGEPSRQIDFYDVKADVEALFGEVELTFQVSQNPALHPGRSADIYIANECVGFMGQLHPKWIQKYDLSQAAIVFELDFNAILRRAKTVYHPVSKYQAARRDLAFVVPEAMTFNTLLQTLKAAASDLVVDIALFDVYQGQGLAEGTKSFAVKVILQDVNATLVDEKVEQEMNKLVAAAATIQAQLRN